MTIATKPKLEIVQPGDRLTLFKDRDAVIRRFLGQAVEAGYAWRDIVNDRLWDVEYQSLEAYIETLREQYNSIGYKQVMFLVSAVNMRDELSDSDAAESDLEMLQSARAHRALKEVPDEDRVEALKRAAGESQARGYQEVSGPLVERAAADIKTERAYEITFEEIQKLFAPYGTFRKLQVFSRKMQQFRYEFLHGPNMHRVYTCSAQKFFKTLEEALEFYAEYLTEDRKLSGPGCLTCRNCQTSEGNEIYCTRQMLLIPLHKVWEGMRNCPDYRAIAGQAEETPLGRMAHSEQVDLPTKQPKKVEPEPVKLGLLNSAGAKCDGTDDWGTPEKYWKPGLEVIQRPHYDLDPSTYPGSPIPALVKFTREDDGLKQDWDVLDGAPIHLWANFPYSLNDEFTERFEQYFEAGLINHAFILDKTDNGVGWYRRLLGLCTSFLLINERVKHISLDSGEEKGGFFSSTLFYYGNAPEAFHDAFEHLGAVCQVTPQELYGR
ncbi:MAG: hypothetical protein F6K42_12600 [Leptolyngbya sp. SIO1D8]|nr:hypothetical protein [Leptolyngbya sp. SIO1D8]